MKDLVAKFNENDLIMNKEDYKDIHYFFTQNNVVVLVDDILNIIINPDCIEDYKDIIELNLPNNGIYINKDAVTKATYVKHNKYISIEALLPILDFLTPRLGKICCDLRYFLLIHRF